ncbi:MAG: DUF4340 domain-containing protein [Chromatiales bacterium]|jgi:hypothetical protein|nr:DUF4340 domain-containing protein [Chromatiales bacterium]
MNRRLVLNFVLLLIVLALAALVWKQPGDVPSVKAQPLTPLHANEVTRLIIEWPASNRAPVSLDKSQGMWRMDAPLHVYANEFRIDALLRVLETASQAHFGAIGRDLREYGLDPPSAVLEADDLRIAFGGSEPLDHRRYIQVGDTIHLTDDLYLFRLQTDYTSFVSTQLLSPNSHPVMIELPGLALTHGEGGRWTASPADGFTPDAINELVDEWRNAQALAVEPADASAVGIGAVRIGFEAGEDIRFEVRERDADLLLVRADLGICYVLTEEQARQLLPMLQNSNVPPLDDAQ